MPPTFNNHLFLDGPELPKGVTRFHFVRHAIVDSTWRSRMYGALDIDLCTDSVAAQKSAYRSLATKLPDDALWFSSPLQRAVDTAHNVHRASRPASSAMPDIRLESSLTEQDLGEWSGMDHHAFLKQVSHPAHPFWSIAANEIPPKGESMDMVRARIGRLMDRLAAENPGRDMTCFSHGGVIRMALAHALDIPTRDALGFSVQNLSRTVIERIGSSYRVVNVNALPDFSS